MRISDWSSDVCSSDLPPRSAPLLRRSIPTRPHCWPKAASTVLPSRGNRLWRPSMTQPDGNVVASRVGTACTQLTGKGYCVLEDVVDAGEIRSVEHTSELQSLMRSSYAVFCLKKKNRKTGRSRKNDTRDKQTQRDIIINTSANQ